VGQWHKHC